MLISQRGLSGIAKSPKRNAREGTAATASIHLQLASDALSERNLGAVNGLLDNLTLSDGISLFTTHVRRAAPDTLDPKLNVHSKLGDITACIQAYTAGADEALMLDPHGFVATCNSTNLFIVIGDGDAAEVLTSDGRYCLAGITRANVLEICRAHRIPARETTFSLTDVYAAREAFVTGTFAGVVPVRSVDGRTIGDGRRGPAVERLQTLYRELVDADVAARTAA